MAKRKNNALTSKSFQRMKGKWKKMKTKGGFKLIGKDAVGKKIGKSLIIVQAVYDKDLSPPLWFEIQTVDGFSFAMHSKNLAAALKRYEGK